MATVPEAKEALNKFKMEAASEVGVNLKQGYNGDLTSKQVVIYHLPIQFLHTSVHTQYHNKLLHIYFINIYHFIVSYIYIK